MYKRIGKLTAIFSLLALLVPAVASAHVVVTPNKAGIGQELVFNVSSPNEREVPIVKVTLDIPKGVDEVTPTVKDGWTITASGQNEITAITWSGGKIPVGQREDFSFSAQVPATSGELDWKAYQTYSDGTVVHWDQKPAGSDDASGNAGPFSVTKVVNDLNTVTPAQSSGGQNSMLPLVISVIAVLVSVAAWLRRPKA